jgi:hypothetical protein
MPKVKALEMLFSLSPDGQPGRDCCSAIDALAYQ